MDAATCRCPACVAREAERYVQAVDQHDHQDPHRALAVSWWQLGGGIPDHPVPVPPIRMATFLATLRGLLLARPTRRRVLDQLLGRDEADEVLAGYRGLKPETWRLLLGALELVEAVGGDR